MLHIWDIIPNMQQESVRYMCMGTGRILQKNIVDYIQINARAQHTARTHTHIDCCIIVEDSYESSTIIQQWRVFK